MLHFPGYGNESSYCIKCGKLVDHPRYSQVLRKDFAPCSYLVNEEVI